MSYELTIEPTGQTVPIAEGQTILDAALRAGVYLPHACCHGLCSTCKVQVLEGEIEHGEASSFALMDFERLENQCLACCATVQSDVVIEADIEEDPDAENLPVQDFTGVITRVQSLTPTIKGLWIQLDTDNLHFQAGQYINLELPEGRCSRAFSIASQPSATELELNIRLVPGGQATTYIYESLQAGDRVKLSGPYGRFFVRKSAQVPLIFMAGGSGLSSPRSMIMDLLAEDCSLPITLVYGQRSVDELYYHDEFLALSQQYPNFQYVPALSHEAEDSSWAGFRGFVHEAAKTHFNGSFQGHKAYLCGPPLMVEACIKTLMQGRLFERDIYTERFISDADAQQVRSPLFRKI